HVCCRTDIVMPPKRDGRAMVDLPHNHFGGLQQLDCPPAMTNNQPADHVFMLTLLFRVPVRNFDAVVLVCDVFRDSVCDAYRPVTSASAADGNRHIGLTFLFILWKKKINEAAHMIEERV